GLVPPQVNQYLQPVLSYQALSDPQTALNTYVANLQTMAQTNPGNHLDVNAFYLDWMNVLNEYGSIDTSVIADTTSYAVYIKGTTRTYVAYNPGELPLVVHFKDAGGTVVDTLTVPGRSMATSTGMVTTAPDLSVQTPPDAFFLTDQPSGSASNSFGFLV